MLSVSAMSGGQGAYYTGLAREDYYLEGGEPPGLWEGKGAALLGLSGQVDKETFAGLFSGVDARGVPLVQNAGMDGRQPGWDLTFSAPKSVSVLWSMLPKELGAEIRAAHTEAVQQACQYLEDVAGWTRRGRGGAIREKAALVVGLFEHGTSRAGDPQLHTHALFLNIGVRQDGTTGSIESKPLYQHKMAAGALYRAELAMQIQKRLGLELERCRTWFEVTAVSQKLIEDWSTRRQEIESALAKSGFSSAKASEMAALTTRQVKEHVARDELFGQWQKHGEKMGWGVKQAQHLCSEEGVTHDPPAVATALALKEALQEITSQHSYFAEKDLVRKMAEHSQGLGIGAKNAIHAAREYLSGHAISLTRQNDQQLYTTPEMLELERKMLARIEESKGDQQHAVGSRTLEKGLSRHSHLSEEQKDAVKHITTGQGSIAAVTGMAGTGKTTMLKAAAEIWQKEGFTVKGAALAGKAADGLASGAGIESATIAKTLLDLEKGKTELTKKTILVVDEAGMIGTRQMDRLVEETQKSGAKLVLVGDARQLQPIDAGGPFASIAERLGDAKMKEIIRQQEGWAREAVHDLADGDAGKALRAFAERGLLSINENRPKARDALMEAWKPEGVSQPAKNLILAGTNEDATILNREAQALRKSAGELGLARLKAGSEKFYEGDRIVFTQNSGPRGVRNGQFGTVTEVELLRRTLHVKLDSGRKVQVPLAEYDHVKLGYAVTTHKSQGMTTQNAFVLTDESMQDKELSYVQASRARGTTRLFTTEQEAGTEMSRLSKVMSESHQKLLATDLLERERRIKDALQTQQERERLGQRQEISLTM
jgi:conjugative relaxase-like TrwC/TraI family protein